MATTGNKDGYLLDTTVFVDYLRQRPITNNIFSDIRANNIFAAYSIITEAELWAGISVLRTEAQHALILKPFQRYFINVSIARRAGELLALIRNSNPRGTSLPTLSDCLIGATAEYYNLEVYTRNHNHFNQFIPFGVMVKTYML